MKQMQKITMPFLRWLDRRHSSETVILVLISVFVGLSSAAGVWVFKRLIELFQRLAFEILSPALTPLGSWLIIVPTILGGLLVGWIMRHWVGHERQHGVAGIMESVALTGGRLPYPHVPAKALASALSIGVGASVGPEDPSVQIGANLGSMIGQLLHLSDERVRSLVAAGAAGGISAAFNAPIAGVFFALEIILGELSGGALSVVVLSSVISAVLTQAVSGREPAFHVPAYTFNSVWELPLYLLLGLAAGIVSALYIRTVYAARDVFKEMALPEWVKPALAGLIVGLTGLILPQVLGVGYETISTIFGGASFSIGILLVLLFAKMVLTPISLGGGFQGGVFAPSLYLGAALGGAFGLGMEKLLPALQITPPAFAMVGMAAVLAGAVRAPLTAILLLFEMTNDYRIILPLMFAVIISTLVSERLHHESVYTLSLLRQGIRLERGRDVEVLEGLLVSEVMTTNVRTLKEDDSLNHALEVFTDSHSHGFPVINQRGELTGVFSIHDLETAQKSNTDLLAHTVGEFLTRQMIVTHPDETLATAMRRMSVNDIGRIPVVENGDPLHMIGLLRRADIIRAYEIALAKRLTRRHRAQQVRLNALSHLPVEETKVEKGSLTAGHTVGEIQWPRNVIIASVLRGGQSLIPHGNTPLQQGDIVIYVAEDNESSEQVKKLCKKL